MIATVLSGGREGFLLIQIWVLAGLFIQVFVFIDYFWLHCLGIRGEGFGFGGGFWVLGLGLWG